MGRASYQGYLEPISFVSEPRAEDALDGKDGCKNTPTGQRASLYTEGADTMPFCHVAGQIWFPISKNNLLSLCCALFVPVEPSLRFQTLICGPLT